jgi:hypothetical protein
MFPAWAATIHYAMLKPGPQPSIVLPWLEPPRKNRSKARICKSGASPMPAFSIGKNPSGGSAVFEIMLKSKQVILDKQERIKYKGKRNRRLTAKVQ